MAYLLLTLLRSVRADFAPEIWSGLGFERAPALFTRLEFWVAPGVVLVNGFSIWIRGNRAVFFLSLLLCALGFALVICQAGAGPKHGGFMLMVLMGLGLHIPYVAVHTTVFERFVAMTREQANIGYLMYFVDTIFCGHHRLSWLLRPHAHARLLTVNRKLSGFLSRAVFLGSLGRAGRSAVFRCIFPAAQAGCGGAIKKGGCPIRDSLLAFG